jgi:hypothetical protein
VEDHNSGLHAGRGSNYGRDEPPGQRREHFQTRDTSVGEANRTPGMQLRYSIKGGALVIGILAL